MARVQFHNQGCRLNNAETATLQAVFEEHGHTCVNGDPDIAVINSCSVTAESEADCRKLIRRIHRHHPDCSIAVTGCYAQAAGESLAQLPGVSLVVGNADKLSLASLLEAENGPKVHTPRPSSAPFEQPVSPRFKNHTRANLKVQDGCDFACAYCIIPRTRGPARSRMRADVLREAQVLVDQGHSELVVTGVNIGTWSHEGHDITALMTQLLETPGLGRLRVSSIEPTTFGDAFIDLLAHPKMCRFLHVPLQSGSQRILQNMRRNYTRAQFADFIEGIAKAHPGLGLGTDVIVGFPGETDADFEETRALLTALPFSYLHVFRYSPRPKTLAARLPDQIPDAQLRQRSTQLRELSTRMRHRYTQTQVGRTRRVIWERPKNGQSRGWTDEYVDAWLVGGHPVVVGQAQDVEVVAALHERVQVRPTIL